MFKFTILFLCALCVVSFLDDSRANLATANLYPAAPYDRCMASFEGNPDQVGQCAVLKLGQ